jgi:hypothetical protein
MFAKLACMTYGGAPSFITLNERKLLENRHGIATEVSKSLVPEISSGGVGGEHGGGRRTVRGARKRVEIPFTIAAKDHATSLQVLHRKTKSVKLDRTKVITSKFADGE